VREWLPIEQAPASILLKDRVLARIVTTAAAETGTLGRGATDGSADLNRLDVAGLGLDPNDENSVDRNHEGLFLIPQSTANGRRVGTRELLVDLQRRHPDRLLLQSNALVERIALDEGPDGQLVAGAVEFLHGRYLYGASPRFAPTPDAQRPGIRRRVTVRREVVLAAGAFNSPQVLMLSGIGPAAHLAEHGIGCKLDLPGVGGNLQDRYEMSVVTEFDRPFGIVDGATFGAPGDPVMADYRTGNPLNPYRTNGILVGIKRRFSGGSEHPELFVFGSPSRFEGYEPGFAVKGVTGRNHFTWAVLRGYTENTSGTVRLRSADPTQPPEINFRYFDDGRGGAKDLAAIREGIDLARTINAASSGYAWLDRAGQKEIFPGPALQDPARMDEFVRKQAWGHHASCSNPMGPAGDPVAVVDSRFTVHGTSNLRIVDASVFRNIPGLFPVLAIFMLAEKAGEVMVADAERTAAAR
jgi:choline dehydrogenase